MYNVTIANATIGNVVKTNIIVPNHSYLIYSTTLLGTPELNKIPDYKTEIFRVNIGISEDGYLQYSVTEITAPKNNHKLTIMFI